MSPKTNLKTPKDLISYSAYILENSHVEPQKVMEVDGGEMIFRISKKGWCFCSVKQPLIFWGVWVFCPLWKVGVGSFFGFQPFRGHTGGILFEKFWRRPSSNPTGQPHPTVPPLTTAKTLVWIRHMLITNGMRNGCNPSGHLSHCFAWKLSGFQTIFLPSPQKQS